MSTPKSDFFSKRLRGLRGEQNKASFSRHLGIAPQVYQRYEDGRIPSSEKLKLISERCNVSVDWLLGRTDASEHKGELLKIGSVSTREMLPYRGMPIKWLEKEAAILMEALPTAPKGRPRLGIIRRILEMILELQERCVDDWTGEKRKPDGTRNVGRWADVEAFEKAVRKPARRDC